MKMLRVVGSNPLMVFLEIFLMSALCQKKNAWAFVSARKKTPGLSSLPEKTSLGFRLCQKKNAWALDSQENHPRAKVTLKRILIFHRVVGSIPTQTTLYFLFF